MDKLVKKTVFFSGNTPEKKDTKPQTHQDFFSEGQDVNDPNVKEEQEMTTKEKNKRHFVANYNMFF